MKIKSIIGTSFVFYLILMIGFNEPAHAVIVWTAQASGTPNDLFSVSAVDANTAWAGGFIGTMLKTTDGGATWLPQTSGSGFGIGSISAVDNLNAWAVGLSASGEVLRTTDGGTTWNTLTLPVSFLTRDVEAVDALTAWVVGDGGTILHTIDGGATWTQQVSGTTINLHGISAVDANIAWAVGGFGGEIAYTIDAGVTWTLQTSGTTQTLLDVAAVDANTAYVVGFAGEILETFDAGATWNTPVAVPAPSGNLVDITAVDANNVWIAGPNGEVWFYDTVTFTEEITPTTEDLQGVSAVDTNTVWAVGLGNPATIIKATNTVIVAQATITGGCELDLSAASITFNPGNPIDNGLDIGTGEITATLQNLVGNIPSSVTAFGTDWTDPSSNVIMSVTHTKVSDISNPDITTKLGLNLVTPTAVGTIPAASSLPTYWDLEIVLDGVDPAYQGTTEQTITFDFTCV